jgi:hypothetical protein
VYLIPGQRVEARSEKHCTGSDHVGTASSTGWGTAPGGTTSPGNDAALYFGGAVLAILVGVAVAVTRFPGGYDWAYTVISTLGSHSHNPAGARWLAGSLLAAAILLWPVTHRLSRAFTAAGRRPAVSTAALRVGLAGAALLALEGLLVLDLSRVTRKGHEIVALLTFMGAYVGVLGLYAHRVRHTGAALWPALLVILPLCAVGISQLFLYFDQRELGWVHTGWREMGVSVWLSFAFWQWLAVACLGIGLAGLVALARHDGRAHRDDASPSAISLIVRRRLSQDSARELSHSAADSSRSGITE